MTATEEAVAEKASTKKASTGTCTSQLVSRQFEKSIAEQACKKEAKT